mmetsp:Transcript_9458/g.14062  ORF Transcript_9458/g.14062 Transcript_9458/m.14062 type:complete len:200 (+) Transcript_9458:46-645(+)|eukprot:CAMPEP_0196801338 /NCGR_PEP_ID=MMETSP1362-20130617/1087_1 /TAXON_ID=163516 /ORGANISM="Leptocylindrus danicus, Strain CCMP1856" /LENGTH=199 /DNA_ID=CAMNT_0042172241 /DNA_START=44 /DNA_END=643 /DNA_ORIENTATION=+
MKVTLSLALIASASALAPAQDSRRAAFAKMAGAAAAAAPIAANAAIGESPRFSVFGLIGDGTSYSEGAAYGSDQSGKVYSPYSVYGEASESSLYKPGRGEDVDRKKAILAETDKRLSKLPAYIEKKQWFNVKDELTRYMYETRGAVRGLAKTTKQKEKADDFFAAIEATYLNATLKKQDACAKAAADSVSTLAAFVGSL